MGEQKVAHVGSGRGEGRCEVTAPVPASEEQPAPQREPVAGWRRDKDDPLGVIEESWTLSDLREVGCYKGSGDYWCWGVRTAPFDGPRGTAPDRRTAMLAAEDAAAERERARVEALGYRMVRK